MNVAECTPVPPGKGGEFHLDALPLHDIRFHIIYTLGSHRGSAHSNLNTCALAVCLMIKAAAGGAHTYPARPRHRMPRTRVALGACFLYEVNALAIALRDTSGFPDSFKYWCSEQGAVSHNIHHPTLIEQPSMSSPFFQPVDIGRTALLLSDVQGELSPRQLAG